MKWVDIDKILKYSFNIFVDELLNSPSNEPENCFLWIRESSFSCCVMG